MANYVLRSYILNNPEAFINSLIAVGAAFIPFSFFSLAIWYEHEKSYKKALKKP